jgi:ABC-type transport system involved in multi-copper enzyme maturation permease subunit
MSTSRAATRSPTRSPLAAIVNYTLRVCIPARRSLLLLPLAGAVVFGLLSRTADENALNGFVGVAGSTMHLLILPITCLVLGDALLGAEIRSGVFAFTWLSPVRYSTIVVGRWLGGCAIAAAILVPAVVAGAVLAGAPSAAGAAVLAVVLGAGAYLALFLAIGATFRRPVVWSLALVVMVEHLLGAALAGIAQLSPGWLAQALLVGLTDPAGDLRREGIPHGWAAAARLALVAAVGLVIATRRLRRLRPASAAD